MTGKVGEFCYRKPVGTLILVCWPKGTVVIFCLAVQVQRMSTAIQWIRI